MAGAPLHPYTAESIPVSAIRNLRTMWPFAAGFAVTGGIMFYIASLQTDAAIKESKFVNPRH